MEFMYTRFSIQLESGVEKKNKNKLLQTKAKWKERERYDSAPLWNK